MKNIAQITILLCLLILASCEPRVELDKSQWGDHAFIDKVNVFDYTIADHELQEFYTNGELTTGIRRSIVSKSTAIDSIAATAIITVSPGTDMSNVGIIFSHRSEKIEPIEGSPTAGYLDDFSGGSYKYRLISADGTRRDWTISFTE